MRTETTICDLPNTILMDILAGFPLKMVLACKCVSKTWYRLLSDPFFARLHLSRSPPRSNVLIFRRSKFPKKACLMELEEDKDDPLQYHQEQFSFSRGKHGNATVIFGSCHGLLLIGYKSGTDLYVYNPIVRTKVYLPSIGNELEEYERRRTHKTKIGKKGDENYEEEEEDDLTFCGIGYSQISHNYKVIKIRNFQAKVCVLGGDSKGHISWRDVDDKPPFYKGAFCSWCNQAGVFICGAIYWYVFQPAPDGHGVVGHICCFDIETEKFVSKLYLSPIPPDLAWHYEPDIRTFRLCSWNGFVGISYSSYGNGRNVDVTRWRMTVMKEDGDNYSLDEELHCALKGGGQQRGLYHLGTLFNGEVIFDRLCRPNSTSSRLCGLGPQSYKEGSKFRRSKLNDCFLEYAYIPSCLSPKEL